MSVEQEILYRDIVRDFSSLSVNISFVEMTENIFLGEKEGRKFSKILEERKLKYL